MIPPLGGSLRKLAVMCSHNLPVPPQVADRYDVSLEKRSETHDDENIVDELINKLYIEPYK